jgi:hypothetical protein
MGLPDDNPSSFGDHYGFGCHAGLEGLASCWQDLVLLVQLFSQKPTDQQPSSTSDAVHPFHHLPMGLPDDNPSSFGDHHYGFGDHAVLEG